MAVLDFGEDRSSSYLVMERLPGTTLRDEIVARGPLPTERVALVMAETLAALAAAHGRGVLHRDIKPSNILLQQDGHTKISDFGIAKSFDLRMDAALPHDDITMTGVVLGTPGYLAPERRSGHPATVQSDLYSVGAVMVETLTGQRLGPEGVHAEQLPPHLRQVACRALAPDPRHRFTSASDMLRAVQTATATPLVALPWHPPGPETATATVPVRPSPSAPGTAHLTPSPSLRIPVRRASARRRRLLTLAALALVAVAGALFVPLEHDMRPTGPATAPSTHPAVHPKTQALTRPTATTDPGSSTITALATSLANGGFPGDGALASALQETAAQPPGKDRESSAAQTLALAGVLLDEGGITPGQYQDVVNVLRPTGATVSTTTVPPQPFEVPFLQGHGHGHGSGSGSGDGGDG